MPVILTLLDEGEGWMENTWTSYVYGLQMLISEDGTPRAKPVLINLIAMFREQFWITFINMLCRFNFLFDFKSNLGQDVRYYFVITFLRSVQFSISLGFQGAVNFVFTKTGSFVIKFKF